MDDRTGELYRDRDTAIEAGVPANHVVEVEVRAITSGPFKGRKYIFQGEKMIRRVHDDELARAGGGPYRMNHRQRLVTV